MRLRPPKPYPPEWPRRLGFISPLWLEIVAAGTSDLETFHFRAVTSVKAGTRPKPEEKEREYGILKKHPVYRDKLIYEKTTTPDPLSRERTLVPQKELLRDITESDDIKYVGKFPDIVIKERGIIEKIPSGGLSEAPELAQASDEYISYQTSVGNFTKKFLGMMPDLQGAIRNPYYPIRGELLGRGIIHSKSHPILRKMRSVIRTDSAFTDASGWSGLGREGIEAIEEVLFNRRWPWDLGVPIRSFGEIGRTPFHWQFYRLSTRDFNIVL